jgi:hypothetical protein
MVALGGVVIGGVLNGCVSWALGRSTLRANARVAALLVIEELMQSMPAMLKLGEQQTWGSLNLAHDFGKREAWEQNRAVLGHALPPEDYMTLAALQRTRRRCPARSGRTTHIETLRR